jgi:hypothetical protein
MKPSDIPQTMLYHQEQHIFGVISPIYGRLRFHQTFDEADFLSLTWGCGLPKLWCCWHQGTTAYWPTAVERLPVITTGIWQRLNTGLAPITWDEHMNQPQDPRPLLLSYQHYYLATKGLRVVPCTIREANAYIKAFHRHSRPVQAALFAVRVTDAMGVVRGAAIVGRPISRLLDVGVHGERKRRTAELVRMATDTTWNVSSLLYGAVRRICKEMGFETLITYTLQEEGGASLRASGWVCEREAGGQQWNSPSRSRLHNSLYDQPKYRWQCTLNPPFPFEYIVQPGGLPEAMPFACHHFIHKSDHSPMPAELATIDGYCMSK